MPSEVHTIKPWHMAFLLAFGLVLCWAFWPVITQSHDRRYKAFGEFFRIGGKIKDYIDSSTNVAAQTMQELVSKGVLSETEHQFMLEHSVRYTPSAMNGRPDQILLAWRFEDGAEYRFHRD